MAKKKTPKYSGKASHVNTKGLAFNAEVPIQVAGEHIAGIIEREGFAKPRAVWEGLKRGDPLYDCFEWNAAKGSAKYRDLQAQKMIRTVKVSIRIAPEVISTQRAFVSIRPDTESQERAYDRIERVMTNVDDRDFVINQLLSQLCGVRKRWRELNDLEECQTALELIDKAIHELQLVVAEG